MIEERKISDPVEEVRKVEKEKKREIIGSKKLHKGHTLYEINSLEQTILPAQFENRPLPIFKEKKGKGMGIMNLPNGGKKIVLHGTPAKRIRVIKKPNCIYISALNRKSLRKKMIKRGIIKIKNGPD